MKVVCYRVVWQKDKSPVVNFSLTHEAPACLDNIRIASYRALRKEKK
ncbi:type I toxin-antitoxin system hok family toxin, partial [Escherichia coli]|nr:type I toxin-antitoxin system hok family toxin [Escherichia coli]